MGFWIFVVKDHVHGKEVIPASAIAAERVKHGFWLVSSRIAAMKELSDGGSAVFFSTGMEGRLFIGEGVFSQQPVPITDELRFHIKGYPSEKLTHFIKLDAARLWTNPVKLEDVLENLSFIKNKFRWYGYFRGSVRKIPEKDYQYLVSAAYSQS
ncbi:MAG: hypothetical protein QXE96_04095 [Candidatus Caldarchaeum sp.]